MQCIGSMYAVSNDRLPLILQQAVRGGTPIDPRYTPRGMLIVFSMISKPKEWSCFIARTFKAECCQRDHVVGRRNNKGTYHDPPRPYLVWFPLKPCPPRHSYPIPPPDLACTTLVATLAERPHKCLHKCPPSSTPRKYCTTMLRLTTKDLSDPGVVPLLRFG